MTGSTHDESRPPGSGGSPAGAAALGWLLLLIPNGLISAHAVATGATPAGVRIETQLYDGGYLAGLALISLAAVAAWRRWAPARIRRFGPLALGGLVAVLAALVLPEDLAGFVHRQAAAGSAVPWIPLAVGLVAVAIVVVSLVHRAGRALRLAAIAAGLGLGLVHPLVQPFDYRGLHLLAAVVAATLIAAGLAPELRRRTAARFIAPVGLALWAAVPFVRPPAEVVWRELVRSAGAVAVPYLAALRDMDARAQALGQTRSDWFRERDGLPAVPPSKWRILPEDGIVILATVDALRADVVGSDEHADLLPTLIGFRRESVHFELARSPSPSSLSSLMGLFTGRYYSQLYWTPKETERWNGRLLPHRDPSVRFPQILEKRGVRTIHLLADHGFDESSGVSYGFRTLRKTAENAGPADELVDLAIAELETIGDGPAFVYMHFFDPHAPYDRGGTDGGPFERYLAEVAIVDRELGRLRKRIRELGLERRTMLIVSADHGEAFGEHGMYYHARSLYEEMLRIPLLVHFPGLEPRRVSEPVSLIDLGPTILDLFGAPTPPQFMGQTLTPLLVGRDVKLTRPLAADSGRRMQALYFDDGKKAIVSLRERTRELYDLREDPGEKRDLVGVPDFDASPYFARLRAFFDVHTLRTDDYEPPWRRF